jgi:hypothetical protein
LVLATSAYRQADWISRTRRSLSYLLKRRMPAQLDEGDGNESEPLPEVSRLHKTREMGPPIPDERVYVIVEAIGEIVRLAY